MECGGSTPLSFFVLWAKEKRKKAASSRRTPKTHTLNLREAPKNKRDATVS